MGGMDTEPAVHVEDAPLDPMFTKRRVALYFDVSGRPVDRLVASGALRG